jgi:hypothetical protein
LSQPQKNQLLSAYLQISAGFVLVLDIGGISMYICYQHHKDAHAKTVLTEIKLSSSDTRFFMAFKQPREKLMFDLIIPLLKAPPVGIRSMDDKLYIWSYLGNTGETVLKSITAVCAALGGVTMLEVPDLAAQAAQGTIRMQPRAAQMKAEEFFYNTTAPSGGPTLTREQIIVKLREVIIFAGVNCPGEPDKKVYRQAAMSLHPDRRNGDGSRMSELNMLWQMYNA